VSRFGLPFGKTAGHTDASAARTARSRHAHEAAQPAREANRFDDYNTPLFRAFFERGEDIDATGVLLKLARDLRLDASSLRAALESRRFEASVLADEREAAESGVSGVPVFVDCRRLALAGAPSPAMLQVLVSRVRR
jgi:predicted DsbA family dithiol-disulfide isomerase